MQEGAMEPESEDERFELPDKEVSSDGGEQPEQ
jgi:hypothetical protein